MIIDTSQGDIEVVGDVKEFKTSIDPKNLEFITTLLSSNLYSDPEQSFIREIVSNAWDSHVEAGTTDVPVIIRFKREDLRWHVTIRDYGVGLSPERFQEVYCNIGSSTKRESNDFIGGFGIGKYSSLACSNTVYITSYYEGTAYYYVMVKSGNSITTNLLMEKPTTEKNGVEVTIKNISNICPYQNALDCIVFFPNVYVDGANTAGRVNGAKLKRFTNFAAASIGISSKLLLGNVLYPCNDSLLPYDTQQFLRKINTTGIVIKFDVGEINITPNRENIIYNPETVKKITDRIAAAKDELDALVDAKLAKDYDDIIEYNDIMSKVSCYDPVSDTLTQYTGYRIEPKNMLSTKITYNGVDLRKSIKELGSLLRLTQPNTRGVIYDGKIYIKRLPYRLEGENTLRSSKVLILNAKARLVEAARLYLKDTYDEYSIMTDITYQEFEAWILREAKHILPADPDKDIILRGIYDSLYKRAKRLNLDTDVDYLNFKKELSSGKESLPVKEAIIYIWDNRGWKEKMHFKKFSKAVDYIRSLKKGIVLGNMDAPAEVLSSVATLKGYKFIQARKDIIKDLRNLNLTCVVDADWLLKKDPLISAVKTALSYFPDVIVVSTVREICDNIPKEEVEKLWKVVRLRNTYGENYFYRKIAEESSVQCDHYIGHLCLKLKNYITKHSEAKSLVNSSGLEDKVLTAAVVMKTRAYRLSSEAYQKVQNNKLLRVLCRK